MTISARWKKCRAAAVRVLVAAASLWLFSAGDLCQVHMERGKDGTVLITDREGGELYQDLGSALKWRRDGKHLQVYDAYLEKWVQAPADYQQVIAGGRLLFAYGPGIQGSAVYDSARHEWVKVFDGYSEALLGEGLAVGKTAQGGIGIYDAKVGAWDRPGISCDEMKLSDMMAAFYGPSDGTAIYDGSRGEIKKIKSSFGRCEIGNQLAVFFGSPSTDTSVYDSTRGQFVELKDPAAAVNLFGALAAVIGPINKAYAYSSETGVWVRFKGEASQADVAGGQVIVTDLSGERWFYAPGQEGFEKVGK